MIHVVAKNIVKSEDRQEFMALANELVAETRKEDGCIYYQLVESIDNALDVAFLELWESEEALKAHTLTPHYKRIVPKFLTMVYDSYVDRYK